MKRKLCLMAMLAATTMTLWAADTPLAQMDVISQEISGANGQLAVKVRLWANKDVYYSSASAVLPSGWQLSSVSYPGTGNFLAALDSVEITYAITYPVNHLPFYPASISVSLAIDQASQNQTAITLIAPPADQERLVAKGKVYFTPYNTTEVWSEGDFMNLKRTWFLKGSSMDTTRISVPKSSVPVSNIQPTDSVSEDWEDELQLKFVPGLAYAVQMKAVHPDIIAAQNIDDGPDSALLAVQARVGRKFSGTITGRLVSTVMNDVGAIVNIPLAGVLIKLKETDKVFNEEFGEVTTDANGNFTITYSVWQSPLEGSNIEPFLRIKSKNRRYAIKVKGSSVLGSSYDATYRLGSRGTSATIVLNDIVINYEPWRLLHWAVRAWDYLEGQNLSLFSGLSILPYRKQSYMLPDGLLGISLPLTRPTIRIKSGDGNNESTMRHEFGHFVMWCLQFRNYIAIYGDPDQHGKHYWENENTSRIAWTEGWADAFEMILDAVYWQEDLEYGFDARGRTYELKRNHSQINRGIWSEYYIACALYDLWDGPGKGVPETVGGSYVGFSDLSVAGIPVGGWTEADNVELSFNQIALPLLLRAGSSDKIQHIGEYFSVLVNNVIGINNCTSVTEVSSLFVQNRVIYDIQLFNTGENTGLSSDPITKQVTVSVDGDLLGIPGTYQDTYDLNPFTNRVDTYDYFLPASGNVALTDDILLNGDSRNTSTLRFNPSVSGASSGTFYTCGNIELNLRYAQVVLGGNNASARLEIRAGSIYRMGAGSVLTISNNSALVIACGAQLIVEPGASIQLNGTNAKLIIDGTLDIRPGATFNYPFSQTSPVITGLDKIPTGGSSYSVNITTAPSYTWTVPAGWSINNQAVSTLTIGGASGSSVTIKPSSTAACNSTGEIRVMVNGCTLSQAAKIVTVSTVPYLYVTTSDDRTPQPSNYTYHSATVQQVPGTVSSNYKWYKMVNGSPSSLIATGLSLVKWPVPPCSSQYYQLQLTTTCGVTVYNGVAYNYYGCSSGYYSYSAFPNPAKEELTIEKSDIPVDVGNVLNSKEALEVINSSQTKSIGNFEGYLYDKFGQKLLAFRSDGQQAALSLARIPAGIYLLKIQDGARSITNRIIIDK